MLQKQKQESQNVSVTTVLFDDRVEINGMNVHTMSKSELKR